MLRQGLAAAALLLCGGACAVAIAPAVGGSDGAVAVDRGATTCAMPLHASQRTALYDIRNVSAPDVGGCCAACEAEPRCKYFEFETVTHPPRCWLKTSGAGPKTHDAKCTSGGIGPPEPPPPLPTPGPCKDDEGCSLCGVCDVSTGRCACDKGFTGEHCEALSMGQPYKCGEGGLCMHGQEVGSHSGVEPTTAFSTWGGSVVPSEDFSEYHMYASMFQWNASLDPKCEGTKHGGCAGWITNSDVVHAVSSTPQGPFRAVDIALGPRGKIIRALNCTYKGGIPGTLCPVTQANDYWDAVTTHTPAAQRDPVSGMYLIYCKGCCSRASSKFLLQAGWLAALTTLVITQTLKTSRC